MNDEEVHQRIVDRESELALSCNAPITAPPDITSTPRADATERSTFTLNEGTLSKRSTKNTHRPHTGKENPALQTLPEELRGDQAMDKSLAQDPWSSDGGLSDDDADMASEQPANEEQTGLNMDAASISALANNLQQSFQGPSPATASPAPPPPPQPPTNITTSSPIEGTDAPGDCTDLDESVQAGNLSTGSRKRTRGGKKHKKQGNQDEQQHTTVKTPRPALPDNQPGTQSKTSPRGPGRPAGSANKKYSKERSSSRQRGLSADMLNQDQMDTAPIPGTSSEGITQPRRSRTGRSPPDHQQTEPNPTTHTNQPGSSVPGSSRPSTGVLATSAVRSSLELPNAPWSTPAIQTISERIRQRCAGGSAEFFVSDELNEVNMEYHPSDNNDLNISVDLDETRTFDMRDLVPADIPILRGTQVRTRDVVQFVVLSRPRCPDGEGPNDEATAWTVPSTTEFHDLIARAECFMIQNKLPCMRAQKWINLWGKVGLVGLSPKNVEYMEDYRTVIEGSPTEDLMFIAH